MQLMAYSLKAMEITRERVYELCIFPPSNSFPASSASVSLSLIQSRYPLPHPNCSPSPQNHKNGLNSQQHNFLCLQWIFIFHLQNVHLIAVFIQPDREMPRRPVNTETHIWFPADLF